MIVLRCTTNVLFGTMLGLQEEIDLATHFMLLANLCRLLGQFVETPRKKVSWLGLGSWESTSELQRFLSDSWLHRNFIP